MASHSATVSFEHTAQVVCRTTTGSREGDAPPTGEAIIEQGPEALGEEDGELRFSADL